MYSDTVDVKCPPPKSLFSVFLNIFLPVEGSLCISVVICVVETVHKIFIKDVLFFVTFDLEAERQLFFFFFCILGLNDL